jgi:hypothetical protein
MERSLLPVKPRRDGKVCRENSGMIYWSIVFKSSGASEIANQSSRSLKYYFGYIYGFET